jgi:hypothetical protein
MRAPTRFAALLLSTTLAACSGSTVGSGVGDRMLQEPPYYAGRLLPADSPSFAVMPIGYQRGAAQSPIFEPEGEQGSALFALLQEMNAFLADSLDVGVALVAATALPGTPPDVHFRCESDGLDECLFPDDGATQPNMHLAIARPSAEWSTALGQALAQSGASHALMITLEFSDYWTYQTNLRGEKVVRLGTRNVIAVPWLTSVETPVSVLQLTGAVLAADGRAARIGAEGLIARRTGILLSAIGGQALVTDEDIEALRTQRRQDLVDTPLAWKVALRNLVAGLTGR